MVKKTHKSHHPEDYDLDILHSEDDLFKWFLLAYMLGKPIQSSVAENTWKLFISKGLDNPWAIQKAGQRKLSRLLVEGKYTRYNHVMSEALMKMSDQLIRMYDGSVMVMINFADNEDQFIKMLKTIYGIGPKTAEIIARETEEFFAERNY